MKVVSLNGADLFVKCLENEDVRYVFGLPGEEIGEVLRALAGSKKIQFILSRHEQAASFMADVYGRITGQAGVCLSTLGPGATNLLTGVADAYLDRAPLVAITGQGGLERNYEESHQYIDIISAYKFLTKWNRTVTRARFIPQVVRKAFQIAQTEKTGSTHIELPEDVAEEEVPVSSSPLTRVSSGTPSVVEKAAVRRVCDIISSSESPLILAGNGAVRSRASNELREFSRSFNIPVANTFMAKGVISSDDPLSIGTMGMPSKDLINCVFDEADLVIAVGYDFVEFSPSKWIGKRRPKIVHIDSAVSETDEYYIADVELVGDIKATLRQLVSEAGRVKRPDFPYATTVRAIIHQELQSFSSDDSYPLKPQRIVYELRKALGPEDILVSDVGMHKLWIARLYPAYSPNTVIISNGFASMGISLPGAIAAKLARPEQKVVAVCGDGGFMMNLHDLETAKRLDLAFVVVIFDDGQYSQIDWKQRSKYGESYFVKFQNPDIVKLAESFHCKAKKISSASDIGPTLSQALDSDEIWVLDVPVDIRENLRLSDRLGENLNCPPR